jgi:predicted RNase H-like HicB family nuclease
MEAIYTAVIQHREPWWIGWIEEVPGVKSRDATRDELVDDLRSALDDVMAMTVRTRRFPALAH